MQKRSDRSDPRLNVGSCIVGRPAGRASSFHQPVPRPFAASASVDCIQGRSRIPDLHSLATVAMPVGGADNVRRLLSCPAPPPANAL